MTKKSMKLKLIKTYGNIRKNFQKNDRTSKNTHTEVMFCKCN